MHGPEILARTMSKPRRLKQSDTLSWQYHPRSDHHSKAACWAILFDLLLASDALREHVREGRVAFGINHKMLDHTNNRPKKLDLVLCRPSLSTAVSASALRSKSFGSLAQAFGIQLTKEEEQLLKELPVLEQRPVGSVLLALEAKAAMTEFAKARPRLYDELASSHVVVHGDTDSAIAVGFAMVNGAATFISPTKNPCIDWGAPMVASRHNQPRELTLTIQRLHQLPRREAPGRQGFDAIAAVAVRCTNDGKTPVTIIQDPSEGALPHGDALHYTTMIDRVVGIYQSRFPRA